MTPFFSIIIPVYNVAPYLRECLDSVVAQTFEDWEAVCVDDGSTDGSIAILNEYMEKDKRFVVLHQANAGVSAARNKGLSRARGMWIGFLDGDDYIAQDWLLDTKNCVDKYAPDIVRGNFVYARFNGKFFQYITMAENCEIIEGRNNILCWAWKSYLNGGWSWLNFYSHSYFKNFAVDFNNKTAVKEDVLFCINLASKARRIVQHGKAGYRYRMRTGSLWRAKRNLKDRTHFLDALRNEWGRVKNLIESAEERSEVAAEIRIAIVNEIKEILTFGVYVGADDCARFVRTIRCFIDDGMLAMKDIPFAYRLIMSIFLRTGKIPCYAFVFKACNAVQNCVLKIRSLFKI